MKFRKRIYALAVSLLLLFNPLISTVYANSFDIINDETSSEILSEGIKHTSTARFTTSGWLDINTLEVDFSNKDNSIDVLYGNEGLGKTSTVSDMAKQTGAVAAINADFFDTKTGSPIGQIVSKGKLISAPPDKNLYGKLSSFNLDNKGNAFLDYWTYNISMDMPSGETIPVATYNKASNGQYLSLYDSHWGQTPGPKNKQKHTEVIVYKDGTVIEVRNDKPKTSITEGNYAIVANGNNAAKLSMLIPGDKVNINISTNPGYKDLQLSISGGTMLVKDGAITPITHDPSPKPTARTAIGSNKDGSKLFLVTVDGRNGKSIGLTEKDMAKLMHDLGAFNALNLDGGGSTTMTVRSLGEREIKTVNNPSDGQERKVTTAIGMFNTAPQGSIKGLKVKGPGNLFAGTYGDINVQAYDEGYNPIDVDMANVQFSLQGVEGTFDKNRFEPSAVGDASLTVKYDGIEEQTNIKVLDKPIILKSNINKINTGFNSKTKIGIYGKDKNGYTALIPADKINWSASGKIGTVQNGTFTSGNANAVGYIKAMFGNVYLNIPVTVGKSADQTETPNNAQLENVDPYNKKIETKDDLDSYNIFVYGQADNDAAINYAIDKANCESSFAVFFGKGAKQSGNLKVPSLSIDSPGLYNFRNSSFIVLDSSKGGIRTTDAQQWFKLKDYLDSAKGTNIFIVLPTPVWGSNGFTDQREAALFENTLKSFKKESGKNVWILYQNSQFYTALNDEIRYIGIGQPANSSGNDIPYALIEVDGSNVYYQKNSLK